VTKAADLIEALLARKPDRPLLERRSRLPYAWAHWIRTRDVVGGAAFSSAALAEVIDARPMPPSRGVLPRLTPWQAFVRLGWQQWDPRPRDERPYHWLAVLASFLIHLGFFILLLWVAVVRMSRPPEAGDDAGRVRMEIVGRGSPAETGGGPGEPQGGGAASPAPARQATARPAARRAQAAAPGKTAAAAATAPPPPPDASAEPTDSTAASEPITAPPMTLPTPRLPEPVIASQPLQVTETPVTTTDFVLPPQQAVELPVPSPREVTPPPVQVRERQVEVVQQPQLVAPRVRAVDAPSLRLPAPAVREREVTTVTAPQITLPQSAPREVSVPQLRGPDVQVRQVELPAVADAAPAPTAAPSPSPAPASAGDSATASTQPQPSGGSTSTNAKAAAAPSSGATASTPGSGTRPSDRPAGNPGASGASGPRAAAKVGGWDTQAPGTDWSVGKQDRSGDAGATGAQGQGLYNADGSVRLAGDGQGSASTQERGAPGGERDSWSRERISSSGTWLKRPPYDYSPTSFDQYWVPNDSLLAEWVRKGVKQVEIPIPGTSTKIKCVVSLLQFGGGCGLTNPNMNEQPAQARPPPDVPFKKELQEDNGSVR